MGMQTPARQFAPFASDDDVMAVVAGFRARRLPVEQWTHQAHLAVGLWHVAEHGEQAAKPLLREGIWRYNEAVGTPNSDTRGYHDTVTLYYVWAAARFLETRPPGTLVDRVNAFVESRLGSKDGIFTFWSRDLLFSVEARRAWTAPDLGPLDAMALIATAVD
jgi:hypothetical protein